MQDETFTPSVAQSNTMHGLCVQLRLDYRKITQPLNTAEAYSAKLAELIAKAKAARDSAAQQVCVAVVACCALHV